MKKSYFTALLCLFVIGLTFGQNIPFTKVSPTLLEEAIEPPIYKRVKISKSIPNYFERLINSGVDMQCGATYNMDSVILELSENDLSSLTANGINYTVEVENLTQYYSERAQKDMARVQSELAVDKSKNTMLRSSSVRNIVVNNIGQHNDSQEIDFKTPQNFNIPSTFGGCLTNSQLNAELDKMRQMYPHLISVKANISPTNQLTHQGLPVYFVKISDNPDVNEAEPQTMYNGMIHSREVASMMNLVYYMWYLLENYENDPFIKNLVDNSELYFIPVLNPDGLEWNERIAPNGGGMQRKNRRLGVCNTSSGASSTANTFEGIDLNRNFGYNWGLPGSSTTPCSDTYRGASGFSENENQMYRDFVLTKNFKYSINHHAYANLSVHTPVANGREDEIAKWGHDMSQYNRYIHGPISMLTVASGDVIVWSAGGPADAQGNTGSGKNILAIAPENGTLAEGGFWPTTALLDICKRSLRQNLITAYYTIKYAKLHDLTQSNVTSLTSNLSFGIERLGQTPGDFTLTVTPVSSNIQSITSPTVQTGMAILEQRNVNATLVLNNTITANEKIEYKVSLSNGDFVLYETNYVKYYNPTVVFSHNPDVSGLTGWTAAGGAWVTTSDAFSGSSAITDANGSYANNLNKTLTTTSGYNLSSTGKVLVQYYAKWDLERNFDFVQIQGSTNGTTWQNLNGSYNKPASSLETVTTHNNKTATSRGFQTAQGGTGSVLYDGDTMDKWVMEEIVIDSQNNSFLIGATNARFRFVLRTDEDNVTDTYSTTFDGFSFDDFRIVKTTDTAPIAICKNTTLSLDVNGNLTVLPSDIDNGSYDDTAIVSSTVSPDTFDCSHLGTSQEVTLTVTDGSGQTSSCKSYVFIISTENPVTTTPAIVYHDKFNATWDAFCGAGDYYLDVSTYPTFGQETLVEWLFSTATTTATNANSDNSTRAITTNSTGTLSLAVGSSGNALSNTGWNNGSNSKSWNVSFSTLNRKNIKVSSKQYSSSSGPKDFKLQYSLNNSSWADVPGANNIVTGANFTSGILNEVALPSACNNQSIVYLRWIMTSNIRVTGGTTTVANTGTSRIDDIVITGDTDLFVAGYENLNVSNVTNYMVTGLTPNTTYYYRVRAEKATLLSGNSNTTSVTTGGLPVIWNGSTWSNTTGPTASIGGIIQGNYSTATNGTFAANTLIIDSGVLTLNSNSGITVVNEFVNNASATNFIVENNANFIQVNDLDNTGSIVVHRNSTPMLRLDYTNWSSPVSGQNLLNFSPLTLTNRFYVYDPLSGSNGAYLPINPSTNSFDEAKGYLIRVANNWSTSTPTIYPGVYSGVPNNGDATLLLGQGATTGYNLIGNPYPSTISANAFIDANLNSTGTINKTIDGTLYFWTHTTQANASGYYLSNNYATYTKLGATSASSSSIFPNGTIQVGQGFLVNATSNSNITFNNAMRTNNLSDQFFRSSNANQNLNENESYTIRLNLNYNNEKVGQQLVGYTSQSTEGIDAGYDGELLAQSNTISFYSLIGNGKYAIQAKGLPFTSADIIPLGFTTPIDGNFSISLNEYDTFFDATNIYLKDNLTNIYHDLKLNDYTFATAIGEYNQRFEIHYTNAQLGNEILNLEVVNLVKFDNKLALKSSEIIKEIEIYDLLGKLIYANRSINENELELENDSFKNQMLVVKVKVNNQWIVKKAI